MTGGGAGMVRGSPIDRSSSFLNCCRFVVALTQFAEYFIGRYEFARVGLRRAYPHLFMQVGKFAF